MKIGILTLPLRNNYGGILQAYALQKVLKNMGHEVITIKESRRLSLWKAPIIYTKRFLFKYVLRKKNAINIFSEQEQKRIFPTITQNTQLFVDKYIQTEDFSEVKKYNATFDAIVVGSDQVWRPKYTGNVVNAYLAFSKKWEIRRIAYAASFGTDKWEYNKWQTRICKSLIKRFNTVSVREKSGVDLCKQYFDIDALQVLDPTMLLDVSHYISLIEKESVEQSKGNLFVYVLDKNETTDRIEQEISSTLEYTPFYSTTDNSKIATIENRIATKVEVWLRSFLDAEFILTDSFHACVFAILFNKPFIVYGNKARGLSRFDSLLQLFKLEDRRVSSETINLAQILKSTINWSEVNEILCAERKASFRFLMKSLDNV